MSEILDRLKQPLLYVLGPAFVVAGVLHFIVPELYVQIVPPIFPAPLALVYLSGLAEIAVGIGLLIPRTRQHAAWATVALLLAIFPANVYMATHGIVIEGMPGGGDPPSLSVGAGSPPRRIDSVGTLVYSITGRPR